MKTARVQAGDLASAFSRLDDKTINAEQANIAFRDSETAVTASVKQGGRSLSDNTEAGRANRTAVLASIQAAQAHAAAVGKQTGSLKEAGAAFDADIGALRRHLTALHLQPAAIQAIIDRYGHLPRSVTTKIHAQDLASAALAKIKRAEDLLYDKNIQVGIVTNLTTRTNKIAVGLGTRGRFGLLRGRLDVDRRTLTGDRQPATRGEHHTLVEDARRRDRGQQLLRVQRAAILRRR